MKYGIAFGELPMHRLSTITFVGLLALTTAGCSSDKESNASAPSAPQPDAKVFVKPPMVQQMAGAMSSVPVLIQPTNGNQRAKQVQKGRQDPFAGLFAQAGLSVPATTSPGTVPQLPSFPVSEGRQVVPGGSGSRSSVGRQSSGSNPSKQQANPNRRNTGSQASTGQSIPLPPPVPDSSETVLPPPLQEPDLASNVAVTGVIQIGSETQAIVQVPNEGTSRYVRVGQRLSNGQVLVKRIEMNEGSDPVVILEQYGTEVARAVGDVPVNSEQTGTTDGSQVPQPSSAEETEDLEQTSTPTDASPVSQPLNNGVPTNTTVPQSVDDGSIPTDTSPVPQPLDENLDSEL